jgi:hypothetical protein
MIQSTPCIVHLNDPTQGAYPSVFLSVNQYKDQFGSYPVAVVKDKAGKLMQCKISSVEVDVPTGTICRVIYKGVDYMSIFLGTFDYSDGKDAYPVAVVRNQAGRLVAMKLGAVHFPESAYLFDREPFRKTEGE